MIKPVASLSALLVAAGLVGCGPDGFDLNIPDGKVPTQDQLANGCHVVPVTGDTITKKPDGSLATTAHDVWPNRADEGPVLSADEVVQACTRYAGCHDPGDAGKRQATLMTCVLYGGPGISGWNDEERAVVSSATNQRWTSLARAILKSDSCASVLAITDHVPDEDAVPSCQEDGCLSICVEPGTFSCQGNVAVSTDHDGKTHTRDCSLSLATCDPGSPTGCTDRTPRRCVHPATDACDGNVRIGCDGEGYVSFHDCARVPGATCQTVDGVGTCVPAKLGDECIDVDAVDDPDACAQGKATVCYQGKKRTVTCTDVGLSSCVQGTCQP